MKRASNLLLAAIMGIVFALSASGDAEAKAKMIFKYPKKLDVVVLSGTFDPSNDPGDFQPADHSAGVVLGNLSDFFFTKGIPEGALAEKRPGVFKYKVRPGDEQRLYLLIVKTKRDKSNLPYYVFKMKMQGDFSICDPQRNSFVSEEVLAVMNYGFYVGGETVWAELTSWQQKPFGWLLGDVELSSE